MIALDAYRVKRTAARKRAKLARKRNRGH